MQCPMANQWSWQMDNMCSVGVYANQQQCFRSVNPYSSYIPNNVIPQYYAPQCPAQTPVRYVPPQPVIQDLPCRQSQAWDYNSMCFDIDGQPCQYTSVVDLEDFM